MLRSERRWHDAANGPLLDREARLLWFATNPTPAAPAPPPDDTDDVDATAAGAPEGGDEAETTETPSRAEQNAEARRAETERNWTRREAERIILKTETDPTLKATDVFARVKALQTELEQHAKTYEYIEELTERSGATESKKIEVAENKKIITEHIARIRAQAHALEDLQIAAWQSGDLTPKQFVERYKYYANDMAAIDKMNAEAEMASYRKSGSWGRTQTEIELDNEKRATARQELIRDLEIAEAEARAKLPENLPADYAPDSMDDKTLWAHYTQKEKDLIIAKLSKAAGFDVILTTVNDDVNAVNEVLNEKKTKETMLMQQREVMERLSKNVDDGSGSATTGGDGNSSNNPFVTAWRAAYGSATAVNDALGIEWLTAYEWMEAFTEVWESVKELRKQKSRIRVSNAAARIGQVASLIPGFGGQALSNLLEQQQEAKNDEIKESFLKELKNNRVDLGFADIFGDGTGGSGMLAYYHQIGDTNRTQAILEFAAGKAMLYGMNDCKWDTYVLPGNIPFRSLLPRQWSEKQVDNWFSNLGFANKQGEDSQIKAGETLASGRSKFEDYTELFGGLVNGMSLWFAKGVANKALSKVKNGEMSATLMLIVADAWENNPLFRKYAHLEKDWWDRLAGDSKPMRIGMSKYDQGHLIAGLKANETDISKADAKRDSKDPNERGKQRVGPLIVAIRKYLISKDPSLANKPKELLSYAAQLWALKPVTLPNGAQATYYSPELLPYHIQYKPDEMREANVKDLGDDFFIERSEIIDTTAEVAQYVGAVREHGFEYPTKARYFFSHIIDAYDDIKSMSKAPDDEFDQASRNFQSKMRSNLDQWIERALKSGVGSEKLLTEKHKKQDGRLLVLTLLEKGLISRGVVEQLASENVPAAKTLLKQSKRLHDVERRKESGSGSGAAESTPSIAA